MIMTVMVTTISTVMSVTVATRRCFMLIRVTVMIMTTMLMLCGSSRANYYRFISAEILILALDSIQPSGLHQAEFHFAKIRASSSFQDAAASLLDAFSAHSKAFGCRGQIMLAATIDFRVSIDGTNAKHANFAVLVVKATSSSLLCTALYMDPAATLSCQGSPGQPNIILGLSLN